MISCWPASPDPCPLRLRLFSPQAHPSGCTDAITFASVPCLSSPLHWLCWGAPRPDRCVRRERRSSARREIGVRAGEVVGHARFGQSRRGLAPTLHVAPRFLLPLARISRIVPVAPDLAHPDAQGQSNLAKQLLRPGRSGKNQSSRRIRDQAPGQDRGRCILILCLCSTTTSSANLDSLQLDLDTIECPEADHYHKSTSSSVSSSSLSANRCWPSAPMLPSEAEHQGIPHSQSLHLIAPA